MSKPYDSMNQLMNTRIRHWRECVYLFFNILRMLETITTIGKSFGLYVIEKAHKNTPDFIGYIFEFFHIGSHLFVDKLTNEYLHTLSSCYMSFHAN